MLGKKYGYYPLDDPKTAWKIDSAVDAGKDVQEKFWDVLIILMPEFVGPEVIIEEAKAKQEKALQEYIDKTVTKYLTVMQKRLVANMSQYPAV